MESFYKLHSHGLRLSVPLEVMQAIQNRFTFNEGKISQ